MAEWHPVCGFEGAYEVNINGEVKSLSRLRKVAKNGKEILMKGRILKPTKTTNGYIEYNLTFRTNRRKVLGHRLVAETFLPNPLDLPCINHKNGNKADNNINNLEWCSYAANNTHAYSTGLKVPYTRLGENNPKNKLNRSEVSSIKARLKNNSIVDLARMFHVHTSTIRDIKHGRTWSWL